MQAGSNDAFETRKVDMTHQASPSASCLRTAAAARDSKSRRGEASLPPFPPRLLAIGLLGLPFCTPAQASPAPLFACATPQGRLSVHDVGDGRVTVRFPKPPNRALARLATEPTSSRYARVGYSGGGEEQLQVRTSAGLLVVYSRTVRTNFAPGEHNHPRFSAGAIFRPANGRAVRRTCRDDAQFTRDIAAGRPRAAPAR